MTEPRRAWRYLLPSIADLLFIGLLLTRVQPTLFHDADTGWHLWAGSVMLAHGPGPIPDTLSFTQPGSLFQNVQWLGEVVLVLFYRHAGYLGIAILAGAVFAATFSWLYRILLRESEDPVAALLVTVLAAQITLIQFLVRPLIFSFPLFLAAHEIVRRPGRHTVWVLPVLTLIWANFHPSAYFAPAMAGFYWLQRPRKSALLLGTVLSTIALGLTPWGFSWLLDVFFSGHGYFGVVDEWTSPKFNDLRFLPFLLMLLLALGARRGAPRLTVHASLWGMAWLAASLMFARFGPYAALAWAPHLVRDLKQGALIDVLGPIRKVWEALRVGLGPMESRLRPGVWAGTAGALALIFAGHLGSIYPNIKDGFGNTRFPKDALLEAERLGLGPRVLCNFGWSGYVSWESQERWKTFIDGRWFFDSAILDDYMTMITLRSGWQDRLGAWSPDWMLLSPDAPLVTAAPLTGKWRVAYQDRVAALLVPIH